MKNRFSTMGQTAFGMFLALSAFGMMYSCSDDYDLDTKSPAFLGGSIYDELKARSNFKNTLRLIDDLGVTSELSKTGSKTLFVADDEAYDVFFRTQEIFKTSNGDFVRSYDQLSKAQKKRLFNNALLNNSYVLEMMSNCAGGEKNLCLRQRGAAHAYDSVAWVGLSEIPNIQTENNKFDIWGLHTKGKAGLYIAENASYKAGDTEEEFPHVTHFLEGQMKEKHITHEDISFLMNYDASSAEFWSDGDNENRSYIFDSRVKEQDVVCMNGYIHVLDKVLVAPGNMAQVIRENGKTNIFSHILDRFSAPYYVRELTEQYNQNNSVSADSVFERRYIALSGSRGKLASIPGAVGNKTDIPTDFSYLDYDPAWIEFASSSSEGREKNMAAMFVPNDKVLSEYFLNGGGEVLMDRYATLPNTPENLEYNLDQIPLSIIQKLVKNLMKSSFNETVPSKYLTIMNDARDQMFPIADGYTTVEDYKKAFDESLLANNGVVYVMNRVIAPADYASVIAPATYSNNTKVMNAVVRADDDYFADYGNAPLQQYFSTYLKAMQSRFSFFVPTDEGLLDYGYIDPASLNNQNTSNYKYWTFKYDGSPTKNRPVLPIAAKAYHYNAGAGLRPSSDEPFPSKTNSDYNGVLTSENGMIKKSLLMEMVNHHIVVHPNNDELGVRADQRYYLSRNGAPVIVKNNIKGVGMQVNGGLQEQLAGTAGEFTCTVTEMYDQSSKTNGYGNGMTYLLDRPMQAATISPYKALVAMENCHIFSTLCETNPYDLVDKAGLLEATKEKYATSNDKKSKLEAEAAKYTIMLRGTYGGASYKVPAGDNRVRFFNNYRYTIYVPTDEVMETEIANGLPTWESIGQLLENLVEEPAKPTKPTDADDTAANIKYEEDLDAYNSAVEHNAPYKLKAQAMIVTLTNFLKCHFQDESVFVDNVSKSGQQFMTAAVHNNDYVRVVVDQSNGKLVVSDADAAHGKVTVSSTVNNVLTRDAEYNVATNTPTYIESSSYVVLHQVDKALHFKALDGGKWSSAWESNKKAKAFLAKYGTQK